MSLYVNYCTIEFSRSKLERFCKKHPESKLNSKLLDIVIELLKAKKNEFEQKYNKYLKDEQNKEQEKIKSNKGNFEIIAIPNYRKTSCKY